MCSVQSYTKNSIGNSGHCMLLDVQMKLIKTTTKTTPNEIKQQLYNNKNAVNIAIDCG